MYEISILRNVITLINGEIDDLYQKSDFSKTSYSTLLPTVVFSSRAPSTVKKYSGACLRWEKWLTQKFEVNCCPVKPIQVDILGHKILPSTSAPVEEAVNAISWVHQIACAEDPTQSEIVKQVLAGAKRMLAHKITEKEPKILSQLVNKFAGVKADLDDVRVITWCLIGFAGFLRYSELAALKESDVMIFSEHNMEVFIESSKTDQYQDGAWVVIARTATKICPVNMTERYISLGEISGSPDQHLFRGITCTKSGVKLRKKGGLSYTRMRELLLEKIEAIGLNPKPYGLHSLRAGGAATAGVPDRLFKRHMCVGVARTQIKDGYVKDSIASRLSVTKDMGL
jgi:hypothetical protein